MNFIKIDDEMISSLDTDEIVGKLENKVQEEFNTLVSEYKEQLIINMADCETPIERMMALHLNYDILECLADEFNAALSVDNQAVIKCKNNEYRVDILVNIGFIETEKNICFVIECNGHDFHEKTKEQVVKDNERQRNMIREGYIVLNFSGSEIYDSASRCACEAKTIIREYCKKHINK